MKNKSVIESITNIWKRVDNTTSMCPDISIGDLQSILIEEIAKNTNFQHFFQDIFTPEDEFVLSAVLLKNRISIDSVIDMWADVLKKGLVYPIHPTSVNGQEYEKYKVLFSTIMDKEIELEVKAEKDILSSVEDLVEACYLIKEDDNESHRLKATSKLLKITW